MRQLGTIKSFIKLFIVWGMDTKSLLIETRVFSKTHGFKTLQTARRRNTRQAHKSAPVFFFSLQRGMQHRTLEERYAIPGGHEHVLRMLQPPFLRQCFLPRLHIYPGYPKSKSPSSPRATSWQPGAGGGGRDPAILSTKWRVRFFMIEEKTKWGKF